MAHKHVVVVLSWVLGCLFAPATVVAQEALAVTWTGDVYRGDVAMGTAQLIGNSGFSSLNSMARDSAGTFYTVSNSQLLTIDADTGLGTPLVTLSLPDVRGLAFDSADQLYAIGHATAGDSLYSVDTATGTATLIGPTGFGRLQSLAIGPGGSIYSYQINSPSQGALGGLVALDPGTGAATYVNQAATDINTSIQFLTFNGSELWGGRSDLFEIDASTAVETMIQPGVFADARGFELFASPQVELFTRSDVNMDGDINLVDAVALLAYLFLPGSTAPVCFDSADVNDDASLSIPDAVFLLSYLFLPGSAAPLAPFPGCGEDTTFDSFDPCLDPNQSC